jgi:PLP dependent protein
MTDVVANRAEVLAKIEAARRKAVKPAPVTTLVAVSKTHAVEPIRALLIAGQRHFGENRVQEAYAKFPALKEEYPDLVLHLIGPLQTNKVREAVGLFDVIHTLDRPKLLAALKAECEKSGRRPCLLVQVNTGAEPQKAGVLPADAPAFIAAAKAAFADRLIGLMCIPPVAEAPAPHFAYLRKLAEDAALAHLSMGMSDDYEIATAFAASFVRVGSAIFGQRAYPNNA